MSAPEKYQRIISDVIRGCKGVANIADDLIVHGKDAGEHDKNLHAVLKDLRERGLTLNGANCQFRLHKLIFLGHNLSREGVSPSEEKIAAVVNVQPPKECLRSVLICTASPVFIKVHPELFTSC